LFCGKYWHKVYLLEVVNNALMEWYDLHSKLPKNNERVVLYHNGRDETAIYDSEETCFNLDNGKKVHLDSKMPLLWRKQLTEQEKSSTNIGKGKTNF
jgi:hypothetical protein